jgi:hypothetical protein
MFSSSRGLAHSNCARGFACRSRFASTMIGTGLTPVSAIRPANTETIAAVSGASASATLRT